MTIQKSKHDNFWYGLFIGLIPVFIFSLLMILTREVSVINNLDQELIVQAIQGTLVVAIFFCICVYFAYFFHRVEVEGKTAVKKGLEVSMFLSIFIIVLIVHIT
jgi:hypothetical protein